MKFNKLIPELTVSNMEKSLKFYTTALGFRVRYTRKNPAFVFLERGKAQIMLEEKHPAPSAWKTGKLNKPFGRGINFQIEVTDIEELIKRIKENGYKPRAPPHTTTYNINGALMRSKEFLITDPDGYLLRFSQEI